MFFKDSLLGFAVVEGDDALSRKIADFAGGVVFQGTSLADSLVDDLGGLLKNTDIVVDFIEDEVILFDFILFLGSFLLEGQFFLVVAAVEVLVLYFLYVMIEGNIFLGEFLFLLKYFEVVFEVVDYVYFSYCPVGGSSRYHLLLQVFLDIGNSGVKGQPLDEDRIIDCFQLSRIVPAGEQIHFKF